MLIALRGNFNEDSSICESAVHSFLTGLTQVLFDGTDTYLYGAGRIAQYDTSGAQYFLGDALGSVRQLVDANEDVLLAQSYEPYGAVLESVGDGTSSYGFAAEMRDSYIKLIYLRSREYDPTIGRFLTEDSWPGNDTVPMSNNAWLYADANPINFVDPSGYITQDEANQADQIVAELQTYEVTVIRDWGYPIGDTGTYSNNPTYWTYWFNDSVDSSKSGIRTICNAWYPGRWSLNELYIVEGAVQNLDAAMKHRMRSFIGPVSISKVPNTCGKGCTTLGHIDLLDQNRIPTQSPNGDLSKCYIYDPGINFDQWTVVHELGHDWDATHNGGLSALLVIDTGGWFGPAFGCDKDNRLPGCNHWWYLYGDKPPKGSDYGFYPREDFAESVTAYIFPKEAQEQVRNYLGTKYEKYLYYSDYTRTMRWAFINWLITHGY